MQLNDRLYTSTEVAEILGVSLRSVYRYLEDGKLVAEIKTATGRLRFTKQNILDFLHPGDKDSSDSTTKAPPVIEETPEVPLQPTSTEKVVQEVKEEADVPTEEDVDWLSKFKASAEKFRKEQEEAQQKVSVPVMKEEPSVETAPVLETVDLDVENVSALVDEPVVEKQIEEPKVEQTAFYYRSLSGGLKDIAQNIDKVSRRSNVDYAFTLNAGLSLYKPLKDPFSVLHVYVRSQDRELFEKLLRLVPSDEPNAQLCIIVSDDANVFETKSELHGLFVASRDQIRQDLTVFNKQELLEEWKTA